MDKKKKVLKVVKKIGSMGIKADSYTWPPCIGILHQPKRPKGKELSNVEKNRIL